MFTATFFKKKTQDAGCPPILSCHLEALASIMVRIKDALALIRQSGLVTELYS